MMRPPRGPQSGKSSERGPAGGCADGGQERAVDRDFCFLLERAREAKLASLA